MKWLVFGLCVVLGGALGAIAGSDWHEVSAAADTLTRADQLRARLARVASELDTVKRQLAAASTRDAATAARTRLFELRVDIVGLEDELASLSRRRPVAADF